MKRTAVLLLAIMSCMSLLATRLWTDPVPVRQGVNIEWFRTGTGTADGGAIYVWSDTKLGERDLYAQKVNAAGTFEWGQPLMVDGKPDRQEDPVIVRTSDNNFIISWIDFSNDLDGNVYAQKVSSGGTLLWQTGGKPVCVFAGVQISLNIVADNAGGAYIIWEDSRNPSKDIYGQHLDGSGNPVWALNGIPIANTDGDESYNTMWEDGAGGMIIGYVHSISGAEDLYVKRFLANGNMAWPSTLTLCNATNKQNKIKMAPINDDSFVFTWMDQRDSIPDIYAQRVSLTGSTLWTDPYIVYTDASAPQPAPQENPRIVQTSDDAVIIVWEDKRNDADDPDLFAQKINLAGQKQWDPNGLAVAVADFAQLGPRMDADPSGGCYVVWDDNRNGNTPNVDIYAQHLSSTGAALWTANGLSVCNAPNEQSGSLIKLAGNNVFVNWMDLSTGSVGIYYQVLNLSGQAQLANNGVEVFWGLSGDAITEQTLVLPRQNDVIAIWQDSRFANLGYQIFCQIVNPDGTQELDINGEPITVSTGQTQLFPSNSLQSVATVLPDDKVAIVWEEKRGANPKVYVQLLNADGTRAWGDTGVAITESSPLRQKDARVSYEDGYLYIGWSNLDLVTTPDGDVQLYHIYGQKINVATGEKMWGPDGIILTPYAGLEERFECYLEALVGRYYVWTRTNISPDSYVNIWTKLVDPDGTAADGWSEAGMPASTHLDWDTSQQAPTVALTDGGLFLTWTDMRVDFTKTLYGQLLSPAGTRVWNPLGVALADAGREQVEPAVIGGQNATFTWMESITGDNQDIAVQRYDLAGNPQFGPLGEYVVQAPAPQTSPSIGAFTESGMVVAWVDVTTIEPDIYYRYIEHDGQFSTPLDDGIITSMLKKQLNPMVAIYKDPSLNTGVIAWSDGRSSGKTDIFGLYMMKISNDTVDNDDDISAVTPALQMAPNYPNPFNPQTTLSFSVKESMHNVELSIYNVKGQIVTTLHQGKTDKGKYSYVWDGRDLKGNHVGTGIYFSKLSSGNKVITRKMVLMK